MANDKGGSRALAVGAVALVLAVLLTAIAVLKASWQLGPQLVASWAFPILRALVFVASGGFILALGAAVPLIVYQRWTLFASRHPQAVKAVVNRSPTLAAIALLLAEFSISAFESGTEENKPISLTFKAFAVLGFWAANELFLQRRALQLLGIAIWIVTLAFLIVGTLVANHWEWSTLLDHLRRLDSAATFGLTFVVVALVVFPVVIGYRSPELFAE